MRTTCRLVKMRTLPYIEPITQDVTKNSLMCKFVMSHCQSLIMIGLRNQHFMILTNHKLCKKAPGKKASSAQGVKVDSDEGGRQ